MTAVSTLSPGDPRRTAPLPSEVLRVRVLGSDYYLMRLQFSLSPLQGDAFVRLSIRPQRLAWGSPGPGALVYCPHRVTASSCEPFACAWSYWHCQGRALLSLLSTLAEQPHCLTGAHRDHRSEGDSHNDSLPQSGPQPPMPRRPRTTRPRTTAGRSIPTWFYRNDKCVIWPQMPQDLTSHVDCLATSGLVSRTGWWGDSKEA